MSMELMVRAMKIKVGNPLRKLVLLKLADNANDLGECWPSYQHIADQCEVDRSTVRKHIKHLETQGLLSIENREGPKGNSSNLYYLTLDKGVGPGSTGGGGGGGPKSTGVGPKSTGVGHGPTPPVGPKSTRTSHAFDPVIEPVSEPLQPAADATDVRVIMDEAESTRVVIPADMPGPKDPKCKTYKPWANYAFAYRNRYHTWPVWNRKVAGQIAQLVERLGADVAHHVSAYYVKINDARLIGDCHSINKLLAGAESFHTQWLTNSQVNVTTAQQHERKQANLTAGQDAAARIMERAGGTANEFL